MDKNEAKNIILSYLEERLHRNKTEFREREIIKSVERCQADVPPLLKSYISYIHEHWGQIDTALIWGSYVREEESDSSVGFLKDAKGEFSDLIIGPSDIDSLLILNSYFDIPARLENYTILDSNLNELGNVKLNLFRDVIVINVKNLQEQLEERYHTYLTFYVNALLQTGVVIKISDQTKAVFSKYIKDEKVLSGIDQYGKRKISLIKGHIDES